MKYYLIAGEASGDLHGSNLIRALQKEDPEAEFRAWGGDKMEAAGATLVKHYRDLDFMGFWEVLQNLRTILSNLKQCQRDIQAWQPDVIIPIDYPGFNLRIAKFAHREHFKVFYYISPQIWAWNVKRVKKIKQYVDHMFVILPFEKEFYKNHDVDVDFVGHPLLDAIEGIEPDPDFREKNKLHKRDIIAILPGSRKQEIQRKLPVMVKMADIFRDYVFVIAGVSSIDNSIYTPYLDQPNIRIVTDDTYQLLMHAKAGLVTSGTATLETALFEVPQVVCYKGGWLSYQIGRRVVKVDYISLVNLIMKKEVVKELIQHEFTTKILRRELEQILEPDVRDRIKDNYKKLKVKLGEGGASENAAQQMYRYLTTG